MKKVTSRRVDPELRKEQVLAYVVHEYLHSVTPVSSQQIVERCLCDVSSATIRNVLAELEEEGFLTHPHTSAGRIPTPDGYRYYVDHVMHEIDLLSIEKKRIQSEYVRGISELEDLLDKTSEILAHETRYPSIISLEGSQGRLFCHGMSFVADYPEFHNVQKIQNVLKVLEEKENLLKLINRHLAEKVRAYIGLEAGFSQVDDCSLIISKYGKDRGPKGRIALLGPTRMNYEKVFSTLEYVCELINRMI
jgi:heat-inducible transcriptional repressor